jgi:hypothetical protein
VFSRFDTMPSKPSLQACRNTTAPSSSVCSLNTMPSGAPRQQPRHLRLAVAEWQRPQILAVELQEVERVQHRARGLVAAVERIEYGNTVRAGDHRLARPG